MADTVDYTFRIFGRKPGEMSLLRLAEYAAHLAKLLGSQEDVRFGGIEDRSTAITAAVPLARKHVFPPRIRAAAGGHGPKDAVMHFRCLNEMLGEDETTAELPIPGGEVILFPGTRKPEPELIIGPVTQVTTIQGTLTRLERKASGPVGFTVIQESGDAISGDASPLVANDLKAYFNGFIRVTGDGRWTRHSDGKWYLDYFRASSFDIPGPGSLAETLMEARAFLSPGEGERMLRRLRELREE